MEKSKSSNLRIPEICISEYNDNVQETLLSERTKTSVDSCHLEPPSRAFPRQSVVSRQSIELFLSSLPADDTEFTNNEIINTVQDIIRSHIGLNEQMTCHEKTSLIIQSHKFHLFLIGLVVLDCICVIIQVILDIVSKDYQDPTLHIIEEVVEIISVLILSMFLISIAFHMIFVPRLFLRVNWKFSMLLLWLLVLF